MTNPNIKMGISGDKGSFSALAALNYLNHHNLSADLNYLIDSKTVLEAIQTHHINLGIIPIVNNLSGLVQMTLDVIGNYNFEVIGQIALEINQCLIAKPGIATHTINKIISHPQALKQCKRYLQKYFLNAEITDYQDTAKAARDLSENILSDTTAVIAPEFSASEYGLHLLDKKIQDASPNLTTFIIVKPRNIL